ncbi:MAG: response regulator [Candidatus Korobacteraceae bacterium]
MENYIAETSVPREIGGVKLTEPIVLCVDDNEVILELLWETLTVNGFRVVCDSNSERARRTIHSMEIDAVVLDYDMPGCNGLELAATVRGNKPQVPILMFSGSLLPSEALKSVSSFVAKSQGVFALIDALRRELDHLQPKSGPQLCAKATDHGQNS